MSFLSGIVWLFFLGSTPTPIESCDLCGRNVRQGYRQGERFYHTTCFRNALKCDKCTEPIISGARRNGRGWLHRACFSRSPFCKACNTAVVSGQYFQDKSGNAFHGRCYEKASKCGLCSVPISKNGIHSGKHVYHQQCHKKASKCLICEEPIRGAFHLDLYDRPTCTSHASKDTCGTCGTPKVAWKLKDGRLSCNRCQDGAVYDGKHVHKRVLALKDYLAKKGMPVRDHLSFELVGRDQLKPHNGDSHPLLVGLFTITHDGSRRQDRKRISVLYGLPRYYFDAVTIHELTHAWQDEYCPKDQSEQLKEGVAELMAWLYLKSIGEKTWIQTFEKKRIEPYATGFQKAHSLYVSLGEKRFLEALTQWHDFPDEY